MAIYPRVIYKITHNVTGRMYIGSTGRFEKRIEEHLTALRGHKHAVEDMQMDFDVYGDNFSVEIIGRMNSIAEAKKEYELMDKYCSRVRGVGYNYRDNHARSNNSTRRPYRERSTTIYRNVKAEMALVDLTLADVAVKLGVTIGTLSSWLTGNRPITLKNAARIKKIIGSELPLEILFKNFEEAS